MSVRLRVGLIVIGVLAAISVFIGTYFPRQAWEASLEALSEELVVVARMTAFSVGPALLFEDRSSAAETLEGVVQATGVSFLVVEDAEGAVFASFGLDSVRRLDYRRSEEPAAGAFLRSSAPVSHQGELLGTVYLGASLAPVRAKITEIRQSIAMLSLLLFLVAAGFTVGLGSYLTKPLVAMIATAREITQGRLDRRAPETSSDEVGELARSMNLMLDHLQEAREDLEVLNLELEERVADRTAELEREVGDRRRSELALQRANARFSRAANAVKGAIYEYDVVGGAIEWTDGLARAFGYRVEDTPREASWKTDRIHPEDIEGFEEQLARAVEGGGDFLSEYRFRGRSGEYRYVWDRASVIRDGEGRPVTFVGVMEDITELRELEQQFFHAQRLEAVGRLAGGVAHDFNNLLTTILGYCDILLSEMPPEHAWVPPVAEIRQASERAAALTDQLLAFSRRQVIHPRLLDLNGIVRDLERMLQRVIGEDIALVSRLAPGSLVVLGDRSQLEQLIMNVVVNARDAMPQGGSIELATGERTLDESFAQRHRGARAGRYCFLEISDTGCGMDEVVLSRIFEPFFTTKELGKGTGLGMSIVYGVVKQGGGYVNVESEPGKGTRICVFLPHREGVPEALQRAVAQPAAPGSERVLVVEDEEPLRRMLVSVLTARGYEVTAAADPESALRIAREAAGRFDLVVSDVVMPGMNGRQMLDRMRREWPGIAVLFVSGYPGDTVLDHGLEGQFAFLPKPFTLDELLGKVRETLDGVTAPE
jgi:PAS domain S-box-containing protein